MSSDQYLVVWLPKEWSVITAGKDVRNHKNGWFWNSSEECESVSCPTCGMGWENLVGRDVAPPSPIQLQWLDFCSSYAIFWSQVLWGEKDLSLGSVWKLLMQLGISFTNDDTEVQRGRVICLRSHSFLVRELELAALPSPCCTALGGERNHSET